MFVALTLVERKNKGIFPSILNILTRSKASLAEASALGGRYLLLTAPAQRDGQPDWNEAADLAGRLRTRMLLPDGLTPPEDSPIRQLTWPGYEKQVLLATACELVSRTRMPLYRRSLGLIDPDAAYTGLLYDLLKYYSSVRVATRDPETYRQAADDMMERLGAPVLTGSSLSILEGCVLILAPGPSIWKADDLWPCPILAGSGFSAPVRCNLISAPRPPVSPELREACPPGIDPNRFAAALWEDQGATDRGYAADRILYLYRDCDLDFAAREIARIGDPSAR